MKKLRVILIGAGNRGTIYTDIMSNLPTQYQVVGVADTIEEHRNYIQTKHGFSKDACFADWEGIFSIPKFADVAIISTQDSLHYAPAMKALEMGYDLLLEKPVAVTEEQCINIYGQAKKFGRKVMVCHVLRYTAFYEKVKALIDAGEVGNIVSIVHEECVGNEHQSHSYVRGNWGNTERSNFMLLAKSCHDLDLIQWMMNKKCTKIQSFGALSYFKRENAPVGAPEYCVQGCPQADICPYNAIKLYFNDKENMWFRTTATKKVAPTDGDVMEAITNTQYGKCVYKCDNDVVDHQTVNMEFENHATAIFTMCAFNKGGRRTHIMGTKGEMLCDFEGDEIQLFRFENRQTELFHPAEKPVDGTLAGGHGGGDTGIVYALYDYLTGSKTAEEVSEIGISCANHQLVFAAEKSRLTNSIINVTQVEKESSNI